MDLRDAVLVALSEYPDQGGAEAEAGLSQSLESGLKVEQAGAGGITNHACRTRQAQAKGSRDAASALFIHEEKAGAAVLPCKGDRGGFAGIKRMGL